MLCIEILLLLILLNHIKKTLRQKILRISIDYNIFHLKRLNKNHLIANKKL